PLRPAVLHCDVAALDIAGFVESLPDRVKRAGLTIGAAEQADHRQRRLLRACHGRPRRGRATDERDEPSPLEGEHRAAPALASPLVSLPQPQAAAEGPASPWDGPELS